MGWQQLDPCLSRDIVIKISMIALIIITIRIEKSTFLKRELS